MKIDPPTTWLIRLGSSPSLSGIAAVSSVLAGSLASFFTGSIRASLALPADPANGSMFAVSNFSLGGEAIAFWVLVLTAAALFALSKYSDSDTDNKHRAFIGRSFHSLKSMPPETFLAQVARFYEESRRTASRLKQLNELGTLGQQDLSKALLVLLDQLAQLAKMYDGKLDSEYRASILLLSRSWPAEQLSKAVREEILREDAHIGVLQFMPELSVSIGSRRGKTAFSPAIAFALPLFKNVGEIEMRNTFPGAPEAFATKKVFECPSVEDLLAALPKRLSNTDHIGPLNTFYTSGPGKGVKSFISLPILIDSWASTKFAWANTEVIGVVNLESNQDSIVKSAAALFSPVVQPFLFLISDLLAMQVIPTSAPGMSGPSIVEKQA